MSFRDQLSQGPQLGLCIMYPSPGVIERIASEWDWVWIDGQHGELGYSDILAIVRACHYVSRPAFVRVAGHDFGAIGKALDTGAEGVIVPCVDTPEQAAAIVQAAKFAPLGNRSYGGRRVVDIRGRNYSQTANDDVILAVQIESPQAIENADAIAALPGVDALFLGPDDVLLRRGIAPDAPRNPQTLGADMKAVMDACRKHGKFGIMVGFGGEMLQECISQGYSMIVSGGDVAFLASGSKQASEAARAIINKNVAAENESDTSLY